LLGVNKNGTETKLHRRNMNSFNMYMRGEFFHSLNNSMKSCASLPTSSLFPTEGDDIRLLFSGQVDPSYPFIRESAHGDGTESQGGFFKINSEKEVGQQTLVPF